MPLPSVKLDPTLLTGAVFRSSPSAVRKTQRGFDARAVPGEQVPYSQAAQLRPGPINDLVALGEEMQTPDHGKYGRGIGDLLSIFRNVDDAGVAATG